jgi:succinyl-CoA synthetase beta subunit
MKIHEYQAKEILRQYGVPTPHGLVCFSADEAIAAAQQLGGSAWVVKAQIHAGGRGQGGGVKVAHSAQGGWRVCRKDSWYAVGYAPDQC